MRRLSILVVFLIAVVALPMPALALADVYVNAATGNDAYDGASPVFTSGLNGPKLTIQAGVGVVSTGGTVHVAAGTYNERVTITTDLSGVTIVGAADAYGKLASDLTLSVVLGGFGFEYAGATTGLTLRNLYLRRNAGFGANVILRDQVATGLNSNFTLENCVLDGQLLTDVGGFYSVSGKFGGDFTINHCEFKDMVDWRVCETSSSGVMAVVVTSYTFTNNWVHGCNGTVALRGFTADFTNDVTVEDNTWEHIGGVASQQGSQWAAIEINQADDVQFHYNSISDVNEGQFGEGQGVQIWQINNMSMTCNHILDCFQGMLIVDFPPGPVSTIGTIVIQLNNIAGNDQYGLSNQEAVMVDARFNWWGAANGPGPIGPGSGDGVSAFVNFTPWLTAALSSVTANIQLEDIVTTSVVRPIKFVSAAVSSGTVAVTKPITFINKLGTATFCFPGGYLSAKDEQHTLYTTVQALSTGPGEYFANLTGVDKLLGGDIDNNDVDDIWDFGIFMAQLNTTGHPYVGLDADINDSGKVTKDDFAILYRHFLQRGDPPVGTTLGQLPLPVNSITIYQLASVVGGLTNAKKADLNRDGRVNATDAKLYYLQNFAVR